MLLDLLNHAHDRQYYTQTHAYRSKNLREILKNISLKLKKINKKNVFVILCLMNVKTNWCTMI